MGNKLEQHLIDPIELEIPTSSDHVLLDNLNSTDYSHLSAAEKTDLIDGGATILHKHNHNILDGLTNNDHTQYYNSAANPIVASGQQLTLAIDPTKLKLDTDNKLTIKFGLIPIKGLIPAYLSSDEINANFDGTGLGIISGNWYGFAICNGNNGTPNLDGKFPRFEVSGAGAIGGSDSSAHTHDRGAHSHAAGTLGASIHITADGYVAGAVPSGPNYTYTRFNGPTTYGTTSATSPSTPCVGATAADGSGDTGVASATDNRPAYYELVPIMRIF